MPKQVTPERQVGRQFTVISFLGFFRTFTGSILGTGIALFILVYWGSNFLSGISASAIAVTYMFSPVVMGRLSDRLGRKTSLQIATSGTLVLAVCYGGVVFAVQAGAAWWLVVLIMVLRAIEGVFNGLFWPVLQASVGDASSYLPCHDTMLLEKRTRKGMNIYNAGWNGGVLCGQLLLSLFVALDMLEVGLFLPVALQAANVTLALFAFKKMRMNEMPASSEAQPASEVAAPVGKPKMQRWVGVVLALVFIFLYGFALGNLNTTTTNLFKARGVAAFIGIVETVRLAMQGIGVSRVELPKKWLALQVMLVLCGMASVFAVLGFLAMGPVEIIFFLAAFAGVGLLFGIVYSESINMISINGSKSSRGLLMGMFESFIGIGFFVGPLLAGYLTQEVSYYASYTAVIVVIALFVVVCLLVWLVARVKHNGN